MAGLQHITIQDTAEYGRVFMDVGFWDQAIAYVARQHYITIKNIEAGEPGTFPTFLINREFTFKFFGDLFFGRECFAAERDVYAMLEASAVRNVPRLITWSFLFPDEATWQWPYVVLGYIDGEPYEKVQENLSQENRLQIAADLAAITYDVHHLPILDGAFIRPGWDWYAAFMQQQTKKVVGNHAEWQSLPAHLLKQIPGYVDDGQALVNTTKTASLVNADIHGAHVLGRYDGDQWKLTGIIDWGDAVVGDIFYELPALHFGTFMGDTSLLRRYLDMYQSPQFQTENFVKKAMTTTLLHEFDVLDGVAKQHDLSAFKTLDELAAFLWDVY